MEKEFEKFWGVNFSDAVPLYYTLRDTYSENWLRIHSLPDSKRYADSKEEMEMILSRNNQIISDEINDNDEIYLVKTDSSNKDNSIIYHSIIYKKVPKLKSIIKNYDEELDIDVFVSKNIWVKNKFNNLLEDIANNKADVFIISIKDQLIFIAYDGGMDIIYKNKEQRDYYKTKYKEWLSKRPDGL